MGQAERPDAARSTIHSGSHRTAAHYLDAQGGSNYGERSATISEPARHLHPVNNQTGEIGDASYPDCSECQRKADEISGLHRDLRGWAIRYRELQRDRAIEAREHPLWAVAEMLFRAWRKRCNHPRSPWTPDRFWQVEPFLSSGKYGATLEVRVILVARAIAGAGFDAFEVKRRNGTVKRFDEWTRIFKDSSTYEDFCCRAPRGWTPVLSAGLLAAIELAEARLAKLREARR